MDIFLVVIGIQLMAGGAIMFAGLKDRQRRESLHRDEVETYRSSNDSYFHANDKLRNELKKVSESCRNNGINYLSEVTKNRKLTEKVEELRAWGKKQRAAVRKPAKNEARGAKWAQK